MLWVSVAKKLEILVLSRKRSLYSTRRLREEGERAGHRVTVVDPLKCVLRFEGGVPSLLLRGRTFPRPHVAVPRVGTSGTAYAISVVRHLDLMGVPLLNSHEPIASAKNKLGCLQLLTSRGIEIPDTLMSRYPRDLGRLIRLVGGPPLILKLLRGTQGTGVVYAESGASVESMLETLWSLGEDILLQQFIAEAKGRDIRTLVVDGKVRAAMRRVARPGEFRANLHRGGTGERVRLSRSAERTAVRAARALGLDVAGVDMLEAADGPKVIEVNASPGFQGLEATTGVNVARHIVGAAVRAARRKR